MTRIITIIAVLIAGLVGLLMSVCGGFFFFAGAVQNLKSATGPGSGAPELGSWSLLLIAGVFLVLGGAVFVVCCRVLWKRLSGNDP